MHGLGVPALATWLAWQLAGAKKQDSCAEALAAAKAEVVRLKEASGGQDLSPSAAIVTSAGIVYGVTQHLLEQTTLDDQAVEVITTQFGNAKAMAKDTANRIAEAELSTLRRRLSEMQVYTRMAPVVEKAREAAQTAQPYVDQYVSPTLTSAKAHVVTVVQKGTSKVLSETWHFVQAFLAAQLEPLYRIIAKAAPEHASSLPKDGVDRLLLLLFVLLTMYITARVALAVCLFWLRLARGILRLSFRLTIALPFFLLRKSFVYTFWMATGFYCCGLCTRRKGHGNAVAENGSKLKEGPVKRKARSAGEEEGSAKDAKPVTLEELDAVLKVALKKTKLETTAKLLIGAATGKPIKNTTLPNNLQGKLLEKAVLRKALGNYKQVDLKKLGL